MGQTRIFYPKPYFGTMPPFFSEGQKEIFSPLIWLHSPKNYPKSVRTDFMKGIHGLRDSIASFVLGRKGL